MADLLPRMSGDPCTKSNALPSHVALPFHVALRFGVDRRGGVAFARASAGSDAQALSQNGAFRFGVAFALASAGSDAEATGG